MESEERRSRFAGGRADLPDASSLAGQRLGHYEIQSPLGSGGMGDVYRARDTKLGRDVALKVLPAAFLSEPGSRARLGREARALAALNHPNIATLFAFEDLTSGAGPAGAIVSGLVMELVEGETLASRLSRAGPNGLPRDEALAVARQIADALQAAHEGGIVHRDLKPANVKITPAGVVKVLDFGLAKLVTDPSAAVPAAAAPTVTGHATLPGLVFGTVPYMSPEQARGEPVDTRTDIWAFGCVLYEMLTGCPAFARSSDAETIAAILERPPDWSVLPAGTPARLRRLLRRLLEKDPRRRLRDVGDARFDLDDDGEPADEAALPARGRSRMRVWAAAAALLAVSAAALWGVWRTADAPAPAAITRTTLLLPANYELDTSDGADPLTISPDGARVAFVARAGAHTQLFVRELAAFEATAIAGTEGAQFPFFAPDGQSLAFFADRKLKRVALRGGAPATICDVTGLGRGGTWSPDGTIVFDPGARGLLRVAATGGAPTLLSTTDQAMDAEDLSWPQFFPDGRALLATVGKAGSPGASLAVLDWRSRQWTRLGPGSQARYIDPGYLLFHAISAREGEIQAVSFDPATFEMRGAPATVLETVYRAQDGGAAYFAVARNGTLVFAPGGYERTLVRVDAVGRRSPLVDDRRGFRMPQVSPDDLRIAVTIDPRPSHIWVYDVNRRSGIPLTTSGHNLMPLWTPDGQRVAYTSDGDIVVRPADASSPAERLVALDGPQYATSWSPDGRMLVFHQLEAEGRYYDIWLTEPGGAARPLVATPASESYGRLSPDGKWLAYQSDESGRLEVYVRRFPDVSAGKWTVSTSGGFAPRWSHDGTRLFYAMGATMMEVPVNARGAGFDFEAPRAMFTGPFDTIYANYAVTRDGQFVMVESDPLERPVNIHVVLNWSQELRRLLAQP